jgi:hypothetical protein
MQTFHLVILLWLLFMSESFRELVQYLVNTKWLVKIVVALVFVKLTSVYRVRPQTEQRREPRDEPKGETPSNEFHVYVDASDRHVGSVILKAGRMVGKHSQKLRGANKKLTTGEKELLGIVEILRHYRNLVFGLKLVVHTNHKNLLYESSSPTQTIVEWRALLEEYNVRYEAYDTPKSSLSSSHDSPSESTEPKPGDNPIDNGNAPGDVADGGTTDLEKAPNGAPPSSDQMISSSSNGSPPSSDEGNSASNDTSSEWDLVGSQSSDGASSHPMESNNSVPTEGTPADGPQVSGSAMKRKRRTRLNPSETSDPERKRQLESRLAALEKQPKAKALKKGKKSKPLSSPHTNMMKWSSS